MKTFFILLTHFLEHYRILFSWRWKTVQATPITSFPQKESPHSTPCGADEAILFFTRSGLLIREYEHGILATFDTDVPVFYSSALEESTLLLHLYVDVLIGVEFEFVVGARFNGSHISTNREFDEFVGGVDKHEFAAGAFGLFFAAGNEPDRDVESKNDNFFHVE
jgi:hypothetical protein